MRINLEIKFISHSIHQNIYVVDGQVEDTEIHSIAKRGIIERILVGERGFFTQVQILPKGL